MCFYISYDIVIYKSMRSLSLLRTLLRTVFWISTSRLSTLLRRMLSPLTLELKVPLI